ncbi:MAG: GNAT family N-acetyltransferase [Candidatus Thermoplasmatota archaeon]|nr:GNAT family N-acetyltransferase [Candidatus Thermoplasmatota archaeon]
MTMTISTMTMMISEGGLRFASEIDLDGIAEVENRAFGEHAYDFVTLKYMVTEANSVTIVFDLKGRILGYATVYFRKNSRVAHLESIAVDPSLQGKGVGKLLLDEIEKISVLNDCNRIILETFEMNKSALSLYQKSGYVVRDVLVNYYTIPFDGSRNAIRLVKKLKNNLE